MNPLLYKAHPLLYITLDWMTNPAIYPLPVLAWLASIYLAFALVGMVGLWWGVNKTAGFAPAWVAAYALALPASLFYLGPMLTILNDVVTHNFHFADRFILVFSVFIVVQMLGALYAVTIRNSRTGEILGLVDGLTVALLLWLLSLPVAGALLSMDGLLKSLGLAAP
jgi:hypothetical protein